jgi:serine/threonine-protein kinase
MGEVYRAKDLRLKRDVAIKVLPTQFKPGSMQLAQFEREAHLLASLNHPNICSIYDVGAEGGTGFIVMEHLQGETLSSRIDRSPISVNVALVYAIQIVEALAVAHGAGLVHRDIKPGNIMLTATGLKLLDFGLAKRHMSAAARPSDDSRAETGPADVTDREGIVGTLHYMAPEQLSGGTVDARSDIWAFGCVVYEMVTGRRAFSGKTLTDVITAIVTDRPVVMTTERGVLPVALQQVVVRCLARNPTERWQSATDVARELRSMLPHAKPGADSANVDPARAPVADSGALPQPVASGLVTPKEQQPGSSRRGRWMAIAATALLLASAGGWYLFGRTAPAPSNSVAVLPFQNIGDTPGVEYVTEGLADGITAELTRRPRIQTIASSRVLHYTSPPDAQSVGRSLGVDRVVTGRVAMRDGRVDVDVEIIDVAKGSASWSGHYSETEGNLLMLERQLAGGILSALGLEAQSQDLVLATMPSELTSDTYRLILRGRFASRRRDENSLRSAIALFTEATTKDPRTATAWAGLAGAYNALAQPSVAALHPNEAFPRAQRAATSALALDASLADAHVALGTVKMFYDRDWQGAGAEFERAIALEAGNPSFHEARAEWLMRVGRSDEALTAARTATRLDPLSVSASYTLGRQLFFARQYSDAVEQLNATIKLDPTYPAAHWALGAAYEKSGRLDDALRQLQGSSTISGDKSAYLAELGYTHARAARPTEAKRVLDRLRATGGGDSGAAFGAALVAAGLNDRDTAFKSIQQAVDEHSPAVTTLGVDPRFDDLRSDPRFRDLLTLVGL